MSTFREILGADYGFCDFVRANNPFLSSKNKGNGAENAEGPLASSKRFMRESLNGSGYVDVNTLPLEKMNVFTGLSSSLEPASNLDSQTAGELTNLSANAISGNARIALLAQGNVRPLTAAVLLK
jgi:hypothetical protein